MARTKRRQYNPPPELNFTDQQRQEAWDAISALKGLMPQLRHFARMITGNPKVDVVVTTQTPYTKGNMIHIRPPLGLGRNHAHSRSVCGKRGEDGKQQCRACRVREVIDFFLYHEIAHVVERSEESANANDRKRAIKYIKTLHPDGVCKHFAEIEPATQPYGLTVQQLAGLCNGYLPLLWNALEDARVNEKSFVARPGLRRVFEVNVNVLMREGDELVGGKVALWKDAPQNSQFCIGAYLLAIDYPITDEFSSEVLEALSDDRLRLIAQRALTASSSHEVFKIAFEVFERANELGFLEVEGCVPPVEAPPSLGNDPDQGDPGEGSGDAESDSNESDSGKSEDGKSSDGETDASGDPSSGGSVDPSTSEEHKPGEQDGNTSGESGDGNKLDESDDEPNDGSSDGVEDSAASGDSSSEEDGQLGEDDTSTGQPGDSTDSSADGSGDKSGKSEKSETSGDSEKSDDQSDSSDGTGNSGSMDKDGNGSGSSDGMESNEADSNGDSNSQGEGSQSDSSSVPSEESSSGDAIESVGSQGGLSSGSGGSSASSEVTDDDDDSEASAGDDGTVDDDGEPVLVEDENGEPRDIWDDEQAEAENDYAHSAPPPEVQYGTPEEAARAIERLLMHGLGEDGVSLLDEMADGDIEEMVGISEHDELPREIVTLIETALNQASYFDDASATVGSVDIVKYPHRTLCWDPIDVSQVYGKPISEVVDILMPDEGLIAKAVRHMRSVLDENKRTRYVGNLKSGRINTRVLGRRAPLEDERIMRKKITPRKRDYVVLIGLDGSGSTGQYDRNAKIKRMAFSQASMLHRLGIPFALYGHTAYTCPAADFDGGFFTSSGVYSLYMLPIKEINEPWNDKTKEKLASMQAMLENLDGHTLEFYRKVLQNRPETDKILIYNTDGKMPAANYTEEREVLEREIRVCEQKGITLLGVGINTDSPKEYGMDTVRVDEDEDLHKVIEQLDRRLSK